LSTWQQVVIGGNLEQFGTKTILGKWETAGMFEKSDEAKVICRFCHWATVQISP